MHKLAFHAQYLDAHFVARIMYVEDAMPQQLCIIITVLIVQYKNVVYVQLIIYVSPV